MQIKLALKLVVIAAVALVLWLPLAMIDTLVHERQARRQEVVDGIAREAVEAQRLVGPVLLLPHKQRWQEQGSIDERTREGRSAFLPEQLRISAILAPEARQRGAYTATLFETELSLRGRFELPAGFGIERAHPQASLELGELELVLGVSDPRGITGMPTLSWGGAAMRFGPGAEAPGIEKGVTARLGRPELPARPLVLDFEIRLPLRGLQRIDFVPTGKDSIVEVSSPWQHPSFTGRYLPRHEAGDAGFNAEWRTSYFATDVNRLYAQCGRRCAELEAVAHGVALFQPTDIYLRLERATKYGFLFIGLTFVVFFLFEVLKQLRLHPIQYGLVGAALATFFLLLLSLGEHIGFGPAYLAAAGAAVALVAFYLTSVLHSLARAASVSGMLAALYGGLYLILGAEDHALLMGSLAVFAVLALVMIATRRIDWYSVGQPAAASGDAAQRSAP